MSSGAKPLKRLTPRHKAVVAMHLSGISAQEIAQTLECKISWVYNTLRDPLVKSILDRGMEIAEDELAALLPLSIEALRKTLMSGTESGRLRAAETVLKSQGKHEKPPLAAESAEDVIGRMMARITVDGKAIIEVGTQVAVKQSP